MDVSYHNEPPKSTEWQLESYDPQGSMVMAVTTVFPEVRELGSQRRHYLIYITDKDSK